MTIAVPSLCHVRSLLVGRGNFTYKIKTVSGFSQTQQCTYCIFILRICFGQLTNIRLCLQNLEYDACSANSIHIIWDLIRLKKCTKIY
jgi:hypothetical protein